MNRYSDTQYIHGIKISLGREEQLGKSLKKFLSGVRTTTTKKIERHYPTGKQQIAGFLTKIHNIKYILIKLLDMLSNNGTEQKA